MSGSQYQSFNCYEVLSVSPKANPQEIKVAFRAASKKSHPDLGGSEEAQKKVNIAYEVLSDPVQKISHDTHWGVFSKKGSSKSKKTKKSYRKEKKSANTNHQAHREKKYYGEDYLSSFKTRFFEELEEEKDQLKFFLEKRVKEYQKRFVKDFHEGKKSIAKSFLYGTAFTVAGYYTAFPLLYLGTAFNTFAFFSNLYGVEVNRRRFSIFNYKSKENIFLYAKQSAEEDTKDEIENLDKGWEKIAFLSSLLLRESGFDDSEEQVARRITATLFLMGYIPSEYYRDSRILVFSDGKDKLVVRFRHRAGQATNINYVEKLYQTMKFLKTTKGFIFCSPGLSGNASKYAKRAGVKDYSLEMMNEWIENVLVSDYDGPEGKIIDSLDVLNKFIGRISATISYGGRYYRRRSRRY